MNYTISDIKNKILVGDCLDHLSKIPDNSIDICFADPPFNLNKDYGNFNDNIYSGDYLFWCKLWIKEIVRVTKKTGSIFIHNMPKWLSHYMQILNEYACFRNWIVWNAPSHASKSGLMSAHYGFLFYTKSKNNSKIYQIRGQHERERKSGYLRKDYGGKKHKLHPFGPMLPDVWNDISRVKHNRDNHPCQLPIHLLERIILLASDENDIILDPFMGTGTTAIASKKLDRNFIGFELNKDYVNIAQQKLQNVKDVSKINDSYVSFFSNEIKTLKDKDWKNISKSFIIPNDIKEIDFKKIVYNE